MNVTVRCLRLELIRVYLTQYFGNGEFADGNPVVNAAFSC